MAEFHIIVRRAFKRAGHTPSAAEYCRALFLAKRAVEAACK